MKLKLHIELDYDPNQWYGKDPESKRFFFKDILGGKLTLSSDEIGDTVGKVKVLTTSPKIFVGAIKL